MNYDEYGDQSSIPKVQTERNQYVRKLKFKRYCNSRAWLVLFGCVLIFLLLFGYHQTVKEVRQEERQKVMAEVVETIKAYGNVEGYQIAYVEFKGEGK